MKKGKPTRNQNLINSYPRNPRESAADPLSTRIRENLRLILLPLWLTFSLLARVV